MTDITFLTQLIADATQVDSDRSILVAGQALAFWGLYYSVDTDIGPNPLASDDIDFFEPSRKRIERILPLLEPILEANGYHLGSAFYPTMDDATPETAKVEVNDNNAPEPIIVDFLAQVAGLTGEEILDNAIELSIDGLTFRVLAPFQCFKARIHNLLELYPTMGVAQSKLDTERERVIHGLTIMRRRMVELHALGHTGEMNHLAAEYVKFARSFIGKKLMVKQHISLVDGLPTTLLSPLFVANQVTYLKERDESIRVKNC